MYSASPQNLRMSTLVFSICSSRFRTQKSCKKITYYTMIHFIEWFNNESISRKKTTRKKTKKHQPNQNQKTNSESHKVNT